jgi:hypothetical protein
MEVSRIGDLSCKGVSLKARRTTEQEYYIRTVMQVSKLNLVVVNLDLGHSTNSEGGSLAATA